MTFERILKAANAGYHNGEAFLDQEMREGERGDGLADFIRQELLECCQGYEDEPCLCVDAAINALMRVQNEIEAVIESIENEFSKED